MIVSYSYLFSNDLSCAVFLLKEECLKHLTIFSKSLDAAS